MYEAEEVLVFHTRGPSQRTDELHRTICFVGGHHMSDFFYSQLNRLDADSFSAILVSAMAVACADGELSSDEVGEIANSISQLTQDVFSYDDISNFLSAAVDEVINNGIDSSIQRAGYAIDDPTLREVALLLASAVGWTTRGINANEGVRLQQLSHELGIGQNRYFELLGEGKALVGR